MRGIGRRLERLEERYGPVPQKGGAWPVADQLEDMMDILRDHRNGRYTYAATDREIGLMGMLCARDELPGGAGEHRYPSRTVVEWRDHGDGIVSATSYGLAQVEDLPEGVREYFEKMDPAKQPARERYLYEKRRLPGEPTGRERVRLHRERVQARTEESKRRDRELIAENRRACGLPPLEAGA